MILGIALAFAGGTLYATGVAIQASEARVVSQEHALKLSLIKKLAVRRRWLTGTFVGLLGWVCEAGALLVAPLSVVQPALAFGLVVLLVLGERILHEPFSAREAAGVLCIIAGVAGIAAIAPERSVDHASLLMLTIVISLLGAISLLPRALDAAGSAPPTLITVGAGSAFACAALISKLVADALSTGSIPSVVLLLLPALVASLLGVTNEMSALQRQRANQVTPLIFMLEMLIPVLLAPFLVGESWRSPALMAVLVAVVGLGAVLVARSGAVTGMVKASTEGS